MSSEITPRNWQRAKNMSRLLRDHGYDYSLVELAVMIVRLANAENATLEQLVTLLIQANDYDPALHKIDRDQAMSDLGF